VKLECLSNFLILIGIVLMKLGFWAQFDFYVLLNSPVLILSADSRLTNIPQMKATIFKLYYRGGWELEL